jgi:hypothetical protein
MFSKSNQSLYKLRSTLKNYGIAGKKDRKTLDHEDLYNTNLDKTPQAKSNTGTNHMVRFIIEICTTHHHG